MRLWSTKRRGYTPSFDVNISKKGGHRDGFVLKYNVYKSNIVLKRLLLKGLLRI